MIIVGIDARKERLRGMWQKIDKIRELAQSLAKTDYRGNPPPEHYIAKKIFDILDGAC